MPILSLLLAVCAAVRLPFALANGGATLAFSSGLVDLTEMYTLLACLDNFGNHNFNDTNYSGYACGYIGHSHWNSRWACYDDSVLIIRDAINHRYSQATCKVQASQHGVTTVFSTKRKCWMGYE